MVQVSNDLDLWFRNYSNLRVAVFKQRLNPFPKKMKWEGFYHWPSGQSKPAQITAPGAVKRKKSEEVHRILNRWIKKRSNGQDFSSQNRHAQPRFEP
jgi:hypothetical protein